jgi:hypothetical protein
VLTVLAALMVAEQLRVADRAWTIWTIDDASGTKRYHGLGRRAALLGSSAFRSRARSSLQEASESFLCPRYRRNRSLPISFR